MSMRTSKLIATSGGIGLVLFIFLLLAIAYYLDQRLNKYASNAINTAIPYSCAEVAAIPLPADAECFTNKGYLIVKIRTAISFYDATSRQMVASATQANNRYTLSLPAFRSPAAEAFLYTFGD